MTAPEVLFDLDIHSKFTVPKLSNKLNIKPIPYYRDFIFFVLA